MPNTIRRRLARLTLIATLAGATLTVAPPPAATHAAGFPSISTASVRFTDPAMLWTPGVSCKFGASARAIGSSKVTLGAYYQDCKASWYKTVCARLWNQVWVMSEAGVLLLKSKTLVRSSCLTAGNGSTSGIMQPVTVVCATTTYAVEVLAFMGSTSSAVMGNTMQVSW